MSQDLAQLQQHIRQAIGSRDFARAEALLLEVTAAEGGIPDWLNLAAIRRQRGDLDGAFLAIREVLRKQPRNFPALLMNATLLEKQGQLRAATHAYASALANLPPEHLLDAPTREAVEHGRTIQARFADDLDRHVRDAIAAAESQCSAAERRRVDTFIRTTLRTRKRYRQEPTDYYYPGLPAIEFYDRSELPWIDEFEAASTAIGGELDSILREDQGELSPYIHYDDHLPLDQWRELNHSPRWSAYHFYERAEPVEHRCSRAPQTIAAIRRLPQAHVPLRSPSAMFSVLQPRTRIPPHHGVANFRLVVHLPLILPGACGFRVGGETREWRYGTAWAFDDTIEHEAWNDSDAARVILICDVWSPRLSPEEQRTIAAVIAATDGFNGVEPSGNI
jgi:aspartyl/asparaginyl beta-hydroxylase (cupin superfamily)